MILFIVHLYQFWKKRFGWWKNKWIEIPCLPCLSVLLLQLKRCSHQLFYFLLFYIIKTKILSQISILFNFKKLYVLGYSKKQIKTQFFPQYIFCVQVWRKWGKWCLLLLIKIKIYWKVSKLEAKVGKKFKYEIAVPNNVRVGIWKHFHILWK